MNPRPKQSNRRLKRWLLAAAAAVAAVAAVVRSGQEIWDPFKPGPSTPLKVDWRLVAVSPQSFSCFFDKKGRVNSDKGELPLYNNTCHQDVVNRMNIKNNGADTISNAYYLILTNREEISVSGTLVGSSPKVLLDNVQPGESVAVCIGTRYTGGSSDNTMPESTSVEIKDNQGSKLGDLTIRAPMARESGRHNNKCDVVSYYPPTGSPKGDGSK